METTRFGALQVWSPWPAGPKTEMFVVFTCFFFLLREQGAQWPWAGRDQMLTGFPICVLSSPLSLSTSLACVAPQSFRHVVA